MTDERIDRFPDSRPDASDDRIDDARDTGGERRPPSTDEGDADPLTREGPDAPDAADIEDPDEQL